MLIARCIAIVKLCLLVMLAGCLTPNYHQRPGGPTGSAERLRETEQPQNAETLIRVDQDGNVYRGNDAPTGPPTADRSQPPASARRSAAKASSDAEAPPSAAVTKSYGELATAIDEPQVDAARVAELVAAHERTAAANGINEASSVEKPATEPVIEQSPSTSAQVISAPATSAEPKVVALPPGVYPTVVRATRFELEYDDQVLGEEGIAKVELYGTRDAGRTWELLGEDADRRSPYTIEMPEEGVFGFRIAVAGKNGLASRAPKNGEMPELWVRVDLSEPIFRANLRPAGETSVVAEQPVAIASPSDKTAPVAQTTTTAKPTIEHPPAASVAQASHIEETQLTPPTPADWKSHLEHAIQTAEVELARDASKDSAASPLTDDDKARLAAHLRMMYVAAGRHEQAIKSTPHDDSQQNEFWGHQMHAVKLLVEPTQAPAARQASAALVELREASDKLAAMSELQVKSLTFCTAANSFGVFETTIERTTWKHNDYSKRKFEPEQPIVLYFEVANFASEQTNSREYPDGAWRTSLRGSYTIVDSSGSPVEQRELKLKDDLCRNRRHDYYVAYKSWIPKLNPGQYSLELLVEDAIAGKIGTSSLDFEVVAQ